jgi:hypothetical protein
MNIYKINIYYKREKLLVELSEPGFSKWREMRVFIYLGILLSFIH